MTTGDEECTGRSPIRVGAIVLAAGESRRMLGIDKIFHPLDGLPLVWHSITVLRSHSLISDIVLVTSKHNLERARELTKLQGAFGEVRIVEGGDRRQDSVKRGLDSLGKCDLVVVHDGARPFIADDLVDRGVAAAIEHGAAIAAVPVKDTIKASDDDGKVARTIPRDKLWAVQTPQIFRTSLLKEAHLRVKQTVTDDASMVEEIGHPVKLFTGSYYNIKVTTPEDLTIANAILDGNSGKEVGFDE